MLISTPPTQDGDMQEQIDSLRAYLNRLSDEIQQVSDRLDVLISELKGGGST